MKTSRVVSLKNLGILNYILKNRVIIILCISFAVGIAIGVFSLDDSSIAKLIADSVFDQLFSTRETRAFFAVFLSSTMLCALLLMICFLCGASLMGIIIVPLFIIVCGFMYGNLSAYLYSQFALKGIAFNAVILMPPTLILFICLTFAARESIGFSLLLAKTTLPKSRPINLCVDFKNYCGRYLLLASIIVFVALIDATLTKTLLHYFNF